MSRLLVAPRLAIRAVAKGQRGYFGALSQNCAGAPTVVVTVVAGPLNFLGSTSSQVPIAACVELSWTQWG
jgi:hypothetical protein